LVLCFRAEVGRASAIPEPSSVTRRITAVIRAEIEQRLIALGFVDHAALL
jgi:hypothetical protein